MRILLVGSSGFLGQYFAEILKGKDDFHLQRLIPESTLFSLTTSTSTISINGTSIQEIFQKAIQLVKPEIVINCIAATSAERCEKNPEEANFVNAEIPLVLAQLCNTFNAKMVQISTDAVFGQIGTCFGLSDLPSPKSIYGKSKFRGEINVMQENNKNLVVRTNFYGRSARRTSLFDYFYAKLKNGNYAVGFTNQIFSPMYIEDLVLNLINALRKNADGIIHMGGSQIISKYDFGLEISKQLNIDSNFVIPSEYENSSEKPYRNLDISLNSKMSEGYIRFDTDLESGIRKAILRARDSKYD